MRYLSLCLAILFLGYSLNAQIGKEFADPDFNGPVIEAITKQYFRSETTASGKVVGLDLPLIITATVENGHTVEVAQRFQFGDDGQYERITREEIDWKDDKIVGIRFYGDQESRGNRVFKRYQPLYDGNRLVAENILYDGEELRGTLLYESHEPEPGVQALTMTLYKPEESENQGCYYIERDQWGKRLHIESVGRDTGLYFQRLRVIGDSIFESINIAASRRERGTKDTFLLRTTKRYDAYGNTTYTLSEAAPFSDPTQYQASISTTTYRYQGDSPTEAVVLSAKDIKGEWINTRHDLVLTLGGSTDSPGGIFSTSAITLSNELEIAEPEIMDSGDAWIERLSQSGIGEWEYHAETESITFRQKDHVIATMNIHLDGLSLRLSPTTTNSHHNALSLRRK